MRRKRLPITIAYGISDRLDALVQALLASRLVRSIAGSRAYRLTAKVFSPVWRLLTLLVRYMRIGIRRFRAFLGRNEVWYWVFTWVSCVILAWLIFQPMWMMKLAGGAFAGIVLLIVTIRSPFAGMMIWLALSPLLNLFVRFKFAEGTPVITADRMCLLVLLIIYVVDSRRSEESPKNTGLHMSMALFTLAMLAATLRSETPKYAAQNVLDTYFTPILVYIFARRWASSEKTLAFSVSMLIFVGFYFSVLGIPEHYLGHTIFRPTAWVEAELGTVRVQGPAESPTVFGMVVTLAALLSLVRMSNDPRTGMKFIYLAVVLLCLCAAAMTMRRAIYLGFVIALMVMLLSSVRTRRVVFASLGVGCLVLIAWWGSLSSSKFYEERLSDMGPIYARMGSANTAWNVAKNNLVFGVGFDQYRNLYREYVQPVEGIPMNTWAGVRTPHNEFLKVLVDGGLIAFIPFAVMLLMIGVTAYRSWRGASTLGPVAHDVAVVFLALCSVYFIRLVQGDALKQGGYSTSIWFFLLGATSGCYLSRARQVVQSVKSAVPGIGPVRAKTRA